MGELQGLAIGLAYVTLGVLVLVVARLVLKLLTPYKLDDELLVRDNPALGLSLTGYFAGTIIIFLGASIGPTGLDAADGPPDLRALALRMGEDLLYALGGIVALNVGRWVLDKAILRRFSTTQEIVRDRNVGVGAAEFGNYVATAFIVAGAVHGQGGGWHTALAFFALGQAMLVLFSWFYELITAYDSQGEIEKDNAAAGVSMGGGLIALGVILCKASCGDFIGWEENLRRFAILAALGLLLLYVLRKVTDGLFLPRTTLAEEIARDRNINAAYLESVVAIGMGAVIFFLV